MRAGNRVKYNNTRPKRLKVPDSMHLPMAIELTAWEIVYLRTAAERDVARRQSSPTDDQNLEAVKLLGSAIGKLDSTFLGD